MHAKFYTVKTYCVSFFAVHFNYRIVVCSWHLKCSRTLIGCPRVYKSKHHSICLKAQCLVGYNVCVLMHSYVCDVECEFLLYCGLLFFQAVLVPMNK